MKRHELYFYIKKLCDEELERIFPDEPFIDTNHPC